MDNEPIIQMVPVEWILKNLVASVDFPDTADLLPTMVLQKARAGGFLSLVDAITTEGFLVPICLVVGPDGSITLGNGHHRFTAAVLLGMDEIPVAFSFDPDDFMLTRTTQPDDVKTYFFCADYNDYDWLRENLLTA